MEASAEAELLPTAIPTEELAQDLPTQTETVPDDASLLQAIGAEELQARNPETEQTVVNDAEANTLQAGMPEPTLDLLGTRIAPGEIRRLLWIAGETTYGSKLETPVYVIRGTRPGPALCLTAAVHGDELNGVEIIRKLVSDISPKKLNGTVIGVPIVNLLGFTRGTRYLPDRRDLNRYFPGNPEGSSASRIAFSFFEDIVRHCDMLIDLHTGSLTRTNMPQVRANLQIPEVLDFTTKFGSTAVLHSTKLRGNLRSAATNYGIPAVALELGEPGSLQMEHVDEGVEIIETVLSGLGMTRQLWKGGESQPVFYSSRWVRVNTGGLLISSVEVGERIQQGAVLGSMVNPITNESFDVVSPYSGRVLGMALNQFMLPGYAAFNIGIVADKAEVVDDARNFSCINAELEPDQIPEELECMPEDYEEFREAIEREDINRGTSEGEEGS
ncbi:MAG: succinylglutamate desuccinylase/aspartoacylase family protein [Haliea sp.]|nr:succinylglutamate desuccinylase/aspartoacylase family protein [Haliea sp.]